MAGGRLGVGAAPATLIDRSFAGRSSSALTVVVHSSSATTSAPAFRAALLRVERVLAG